jgi:hypothetical protein
MFEVQESPYWDPKAWKPIILQSCESEPSVRHAAIAIGAMSRSYTPSLCAERQKAMLRGLNCQREASDIPPLDGMNPHFQEAIRHYDIAIKKMREDIALGRLDLRMTLITCIMIVCFEFLHGNHETATSQLQSGIGLGNDWLSRKNVDPSQAAGVSSSTPELEDCLVQLFVRSDIRVCSLVDRIPNPETLQANNQDTNNIALQIPTIFGSMKEARTTLELLFQRSSHFVDSASHSNLSFLDNKLGTIMLDEENRSGFQHFDNEIWMLANLPALASPFLDMFQSSNSVQQEELLADINLWIKAFDPILEQSLELGGINCVSALSLSTTMITIGICVAAAFSTSELVYDMFTSEFRTIVSQSAVILETLEKVSNVSSFVHLACSLDLGVLPPLYVTMIKCRDPIIRHEIIQLLASFPKKEGELDSVTISELGGWVAEIEEEAMQDGWIPDRERVRLPGIDYGIGSSRAQMRCWKIADEEFVLKTKELF